jgi:hypothetical protein
MAISEKKTTVAKHLVQTLPILYHGFTHGGDAILVESPINFARVAALHVAIDDR